MDFAKDLDSTGLPDTYSAYYFAEDLVAIGWSREDARTFLQAFTSASFIGYLVYRIVNERLSYEQVQSR